MYEEGEINMKRERECYFVLKTNKNEDQEQQNSDISTYNNSLMII